MHCKAAQNLVVFSQHRQHGFKCTWTGLNKMAVQELVAFSTSSGEVSEFRTGSKLLFQDCTMFFSYDLASYLLHYACPKPSPSAVNDKKCHLLFGLFKRYGIETFTKHPSFKEVIDEILNICAKNCDVTKVAKEILVMIARIRKVHKVNDDYHAAISYLTESRGLDLNALKGSEFSNLMNCLGKILLHLCSVFSTPTTDVFLHTKLNAKKINLLWRGILQYLPANTCCSGSVDLVRLFIGRGCSVNKALYRLDFSTISRGDRCLEERFNDFLEILEILMDHGARLNPRPFYEEPFLHGVLKAHSEFFGESDSHPKLCEFIIGCIERGVDPKATSLTVDEQPSDLLTEVCALYDADDKSELIEYLCDCGAGERLYRNDGADVWSMLCYSSQCNVASPRFNESLLTLLRRGLRTDFIDLDDNNVLQMYLHLYAYNVDFEGCCLTGWLRKLDELKFWDVLSALLDAGVQVSHVNYDGEIPFDLLKRIMRGNPKDLEPVCSECCQRHATEQSLASNLNPRLMKARECIGRLSSVSHQSM